MGQWLRTWESNTDIFPFLVIAFTTELLLNHLLLYTILSADSIYRNVHATLRSFSEKENRFFWIWIIYKCNFKNKQKANKRIDAEDRPVAAAEEEGRRRTKWVKGSNVWWWMETSLWVVSTLQWIQIRNYILIPYTQPYRCHKPIPQLKRKLLITSLITQLGLVPPGYLAKCGTPSTLLVCAPQPSPAKRWSQCRYRRGGCENYSQTHRQSPGRSGWLIPNGQ